MEWTLVLFDVESIPLESKNLPLELIPGLTSESEFYPLRWMCYVSTIAGPLDLKIYSRVHEDPIFPTEKKRSRNIDFSTRYRAVNLHHFDGRSKGDWFSHFCMPHLHAPQSLKLEQRITVCHINRNPIAWSLSLKRAFLDKLILSKVFVVYTHWLESAMNKPDVSYTWKENR